MDTTRLTFAIGGPNARRHKARVWPSTRGQPLDGCELTDALLLAHLHDLAHVLAARLGETVVEGRF
jgi:hypothetical protein